MNSPSFHAWLVFELEFGTTQLPQLPTSMIRTWYADQTPTIRHCFIAFRMNLPSDWGKNLRYRYRCSNLELVGRSGVEVIHAMHQAVVPVTLHRIYFCCFPPQPIDFPYCTPLDLDFQWSECVLKSNKSSFISSRKEQVQNTQLHAKSSLSTALSLWSPTWPVLTAARILPSIPRVSPSSHAVVFSGTRVPLKVSSDIPVFLKLSTGTPLSLKIFFGSPVYLLGVGSARWPSISAPWIGYTQRP